MRSIATQFKHTLTGIAVDARGQLYAAGDAEVQCFDPQGRLRARWSTSLPALCVAVRSDGFVYAGEDRQVEVFDGAGRLIRRWRDPKLAGRLTAIGFCGDSVLLGDTWDRAIHRFDLDGHHRNTIGKDNPVQGFLIPNGVVDFGVAANGSIFAANPGKHRVERYSLEGHLLGHVGRFHGTDPAGFTGCCNPTNVAVGRALYTAEKAVPRVKAYDFEGRLLTVTASGVFDPNCKNMDLAAGPNGEVYAADPVRRAIWVFESAS